MYLIVGGLGTTKTYFKNLISSLQRHSLVSFYELTVYDSQKHENNLTRQILGLIKTRHISVIAFSSGCGITLDICKKQNIWDRIDRLYLVEQPNMLLDLYSVNEPLDLSRMHPNNHPLLITSSILYKCHVAAIACNSRLYQRLLDSPFMKPFLILLLNLSDKLQNNHCPSTVNKEILQHGFNSIREFMYNVLFKYDPLQAIKLPHENQKKIKVITFQDSVISRIWKTIEQNCTSYISVSCMMTKEKHHSINSSMFSSLIETVDPV